MAMCIGSTLIFTSEGRGQPVSLQLEIDGCSEHGSNDNLLAGEWQELFNTKHQYSTSSRHCATEVTIGVMDCSSHFFVLGERNKITDQASSYQQNLYAFRASGSRSLAAIKTELFGKHCFDNSDEEGLEILPTAVAKKVSNRLIVGTTGQLPPQDEHYLPGSIFRLCRAEQPQEMDSAIEAVRYSRDSTFASCVDPAGVSYPVAVRRIGKATTPVHQPLRDHLNTKNHFAATNLGNELRQLEGRNLLLSEDDEKSLEVYYTTSQSELDAYEEKGSSSESQSETEIYPDVVDDRFASAGAESSSSEEILVTTPPNLLHSYSDNEPENTDGCEPTLVDIPPSTPTYKAMQVTTPTKNRPESSTVAEEEVFEQAVPPTPNETKQQQHLLVGRREIHDVVMQLVNVEAVEEKSTSGSDDTKRETETGIMGLPLGMHAQQQTKQNDDALVISHSQRHPNVFTDAGSTPPQNLAYSSSVVPGITQQQPCNNSNRFSFADQAPTNFHSHHVHPQNTPYNAYGNFPPALSSVAKRVPKTLDYHHPSTVQRVQHPYGGSIQQRSRFKNLQPYYPLQPGKIIYSASGRIFQEGSILPLEQLTDKPQKIGSGGNGTVFSFKFMKEEFAVKETEFRSEEMDVWAKFNHPNVMPLLAVVVKEQQSMCWQFMPKMDNDLSCLVDYSTLMSIRERQEDLWMPAHDNFKHILRKTLTGLEYLHRNGLVHRDIKERNVVYKMRCDHGIPYECLCHTDRKCLVQIVDFDVTSNVRPAPIHHMIGTKHYRPPEMLAKGMVDTSVDVYAVGCMAIKLCDGRQNHVDEVEQLFKVVPYSDGSIRELLNMKLKFENILASDHADIHAIGKFIKRCINDISGKRATAFDLLKDPYLN